LSRTIEETDAPDQGVWNDVVLMNAALGRLEVHSMASTQGPYHLLFLCVPFETPFVARGLKIILAPAIWPLSSGYSAGVESGPLQQLGQLGDVGGDAPGLVLGQLLRFEGMI
jgi:hypothetical protein